MKSLLVIILNSLARMILGRYKPRIIGITGSVGKTSTKEAVHSVLKNHFLTRASASSYNNEFGLPLTIIGSSSPGKNLFLWLVTFIKAFGVLISGKYPQILILEMGADRTGDIKKLLEVTGKINTVVITDIGISHLENYSNPQALVNEKLSILKGLSSNGMAVLNTDNQTIHDSLGRIKQNQIHYGFGPEAELKASDFQFIKSNGEYGMNFKVHYKGTVVPFFMPNTLGSPSVYAALAACGVAINLGLNLVNASEGLRSFEGPPGRLRMIYGVKRTWIIDDTYNSAPASTIAGLTVLNQVASARKVVVLGDMAELGEKNEEGHKQVAVKIQEIGADLVFLVGQKSKIIQQELLDRRFSGVVQWFATADDARMTVQNKIMEGDTILIKGSQSMRMEKVVKEIMADPMSAEKLLVRQSGKWLKS